MPTICRSILNKEAVFTLKNLDFPTHVSYDAYHKTDMLVNSYPRDFDMKNEVINLILEEKIIAIARGITPEQCVKVARALYDGGIRLMEVTFDATGKTPASETARSIHGIMEALGGKMLIGAGTVMTTSHVETAYHAGAVFAISPHVNEGVIGRTLSLGMVSMPGSMTPTEAATASYYGADFVKIFPAGQLGATYIKALRDPLSHINFLAVGGINDNNIGEFLNAGCCGVGIGGSLVNRKLIESGNYTMITDYARKIVSEAKTDRR